MRALSNTVLPLELRCLNSPLLLAVRFALSLVSYVLTDLAGGLLLLGACLLLVELKAESKEFTSLTCGLSLA
jgi:hypothetical protein